MVQIHVCRFAWTWILISLILNTSLDDSPTSCWDNSGRWTWEVWSSQRDFALRNVACPKGERLQCDHRSGWTRLIFQTPRGGGGGRGGLGCDHRSGILQHRIFLPQCSLGSIAATEDKWTCSTDQKWAFLLYFRPELLLPFSSEMTYLGEGKSYSNCSHNDKMVSEPVPNSI